MQNEVVGEIADALGVLLRRATRVQLYKTLTADMGEALDEWTYPVLSAVARIGPRSAADLAAEVGLDRSGVTRRASRLEQAGLLSREPDPSTGARPCWSSPSRANVRWTSYAVVWPRTSPQASRPGRPAKPRRSPAA